jgi:small-conductance mechanosensitive channel/CRP-like cAMP-binding protein
LLEAVLAFGWQPLSPYLLAAAALLVLLLRLSGQDRASVYRTGLLFIAGMAGQLFAGLLHTAGAAAVPRVVFDISLLVTGIALIRLAGMLVFRALLPRLKLSAPRIVEDIVIIFFYMAWILVRLRAGGFDPSSLLASTAVATAVIAFAMQDTLGNILGGLAIQLDSSISVGDWIKIDDVIGRVADIRWRSTAIETRNWETVIIPNSLLMKNKFSVLGERDGMPRQWRRHILFNVDLAAPPTRVIPAIEKAICEAEISHVAHTPAPNCVLLGFEHGYGCYDLRYWLTDLAVDDPTDSQVRVHIYTALQRAGLRLAVEERDIRLTEQTEAHRIQVLEREIERRLAALKVVDLFAGLNADELRTVAERLTYSPFAQGEVITRQGNVAHWLYILTAGEADIVVDAPGMGRQLINTLGPGTFFGEAGIMTGAPRSATVIARSNAECYRLDKSALEGILHARPELIDEISRIMISRQGALAAAVSEHTQNTQALARRHTELLEKIRTFFGLGADR